MILVILLLVFGTAGLVMVIAWMNGLSLLNDKGFAVRLFLFTLVAMTAITFGVPWLVTHG